MLCLSLLACHFHDIFFDYLFISELRMFIIELQVFECWVSAKIFFQQQKTFISLFNICWLSLSPTEPPSFSFVWFFFLFLFFFRFSLLTIFFLDFYDFFSLWNLINFLFLLLDSFRCLINFNTLFLNFNFLDLVLCFEIFCQFH